MTYLIKDVLKKRYNELYKLIPDHEKTVYDSLTFDDIFQDCIVTLLKDRRKFDSEEDCYQYIRQHVLREISYSKKRKNLKVILVGDMSEEKSACDEPFN